MQSLTKKSSSTLTSISKMSKNVSQSQKILKKKPMTFKKALTKIQPQVQIGRQNLFHSQTPTINCQNFNFNRNNSKKLKTCFTFSLQTNDKSQKSLKNISYSKKSTNRNFLTIDHNQKSQNNFVLSLFDGESTDRERSSKQLKEVKNCYLQCNSSIIKNSSKTTFVQGPFQALQRQIQKKKQQERKKSSSSLENLSKQMIQELKHRQFYDKQNLILRSRFRSYAHSRSQKSAFTHAFLNRSTIEKSHQSINKRSQSLKDENKQTNNKVHQKSYQKIRQLITQCKQVQNQERIKKQMGMFTFYSREFGKKCEQKFKRFERMSKMQHDFTNDTKNGNNNSKVLRKSKLVFDPMI